MHKIAKGRLVYSPSNLTVYMDSPFASWMDHFSLLYPDGAPSSDPEDALNQSLQKRGYQTEGLVFLPLAHEGNTQGSDEEAIGWQHMLFVAPYNHQVTKLKMALGEQAKIGSVDKFQGQEAPIVFFSLCASDASESPRGIDFLFDKHRLNVAISRAQVLAIVGGQSCPDVHARQLDQSYTKSQRDRYVGSIPY